MSAAATPIRREPPAFRRAEVAAVEGRSPRLVSVTLHGPNLVGFPTPEPAASVRLLLPRPGAELEVPAWTGNEFLDADGQRPIIRTLTPLRVDGDRGSLDVEVVLHGSGPLSDWARAARPGDPVALSGPGRGSMPSPGGAHHWVAGDESAIPAIGQVIEALPDGAKVTVAIEVAHRDARVDLPAGADVSWHHRDVDARPGDALVEAVAAWSPTPGDRVWAAGEAAAVQRIRKHLFDTVGMDRAHTVIRGYWKLV